MADAHSYKLGKIMIGHVWAKPPEAGDDGIAVFGPIFNQNGEPVHLVGASSPVADSVRFRISKDGNVSWPKSIDFQPGKPLALAPWRQHIWLSGLHHPLKDGDEFDLTLDFADKGKITVEVMVENAAGD